MLITSGSWWICLKFFKKFLYIKSSQLRTVFKKMPIILNENSKIEIVQKHIITYLRFLFSGFDTFPLMP
jgi:hypothetical protein